MINFYLFYLSYCTIFNIYKPKAKKWIGDAMSGNLLSPVGPSRINPFSLNVSYWYPKIPTLPSSDSTCVWPDKVLHASHYKRSWSSGWPGSSVSSLTHCTYENVLNGTCRDIVFYMNFSNFKKKGGGENNIFQYFKIILAWNINNSIYLCYLHFFFNSLLLL